MNMHIIYKRHSSNGNGGSPYPQHVRPVGIYM